MKAIILIILITAVSFISSCGDDSSTNSSMTTYKYTGFDSTGTKIISGYLWLESADSSMIKGRWAFKQVGTCQNIGPQIGKGNFEGHKDSRGSMNLNLNPGYIDNNVILDGSLLDAHYNGSWSYIGYPGIINLGTFEATKF
jgi:hypothetical protein